MAPGARRPGRAAIAARGPGASGAFLAGGKGLGFRDSKVRVGGLNLGLGDLLTHKLTKNKVCASLTRLKLYRVRMQRWGRIKVQGFNFSVEGLELGFGD